MTPAIYGSLHTVFGNTIYIQANGHWFNDPKDSTSIPSGLINHPIFDKKNHGIWMSGTPSFIFFDITTEKFYHCRNNPKDIKLLNDKIEATLTVLDTNNNIWFLESKNHQNIYYYSYDNNSIHSVPLNRTRGPFDLNLDNKNKIWIHFWHGRSFIYDPSTRSLDSIFLDNFHSQSAISNNANNIFIDNQNNYWITTLSGISIYNPMAQAVKYFIINDNRITDDGRELLITNITEQNDSILWLGTAQGLYRYNQTQRRGKFITNFPLLPDNNNQSIRTLCFQNDSILCVAAWTSFFRYNIHSKKIVGGINKIQFPQSIITDLQGNIWVATWLNGLYEFSSHGKLLKHLLHDSDSGETVFSNNLVCFGKADSPDKLWIGYNGGDGFSDFNISEQRFRHYKVKKNKENFATYSINCIREDERKNLWMGTFGRGLIYFDPVKESFQTFMQSDGLKGNFINSIVPDNNSRLWISTTTGLNIIDTKSHNIIQTDIDLNFNGNDFVANGMMRKNKKLLFFAGNKIVEIDPSSYYKSTGINQILFANFKIFDKEEYLPTDSTGEMALANLSHRQNFFSVGYSLLKSNPNSFTQYAYQLKGFDKDWNYVRERRTAYYTNVPPGKYKFQVKATDENGNWIYLSKPLSIAIAPPLWLRWWFIAAIGVLIITGLYAFYRFRLNQLKKIFQLRDKISKDLHDDIGASLSSIHIYSSVAEKTVEGDAEKSKSILKQINFNTRKVMEDMSDIVWAMNTKKTEELNFSNRIKNYGYDLLSPKNIECNYLIDAGTEKKLRRPEARKNILLIVKEAMNNIAKYSGASHAEVHITTDAANILIRISDNGKGFDKNTVQKGNGLNNMNQRSAILGGNFIYSSSPGKGTTIQCCIPLTNISDR